MTENLSLPGNYGFINASSGGDRRYIVRGTQNARDKLFDGIFFEDLINSFPVFSRKPFSTINLLAIADVSGNKTTSHAWNACIMHLKSMEECHFRLLRLLRSELPFQYTVGCERKFSEIKFIKNYITSITDSINIFR